MMASSSEQIPKNPWRRYFARTIDNVLVSIISLPTFFIVAFVISIPLTLLGIHAETTDPRIAKLILNILFVLVVCGVMIVGETILLTTWGTTPGKCLLGLCVKTAQGNMLDWPHALKRSAWINAALFGVAWVPVLGVVFSTLFMLYQRRKLLASGYTSWDQEQQTIVARI